MYPRVDGKFRVENAASDAELLEVQLQAVAAVDVGDEDDALALDELELEDDVGEQELFVFGTSIRVLVSITECADVGATHLTTYCDTPSPSASFSSRSRTAGFREKIPLSVLTSVVRVALMSIVCTAFGSFFATFSKSSS